MLIRFINIVFKMIFGVFGQPQQHKTKEKAEGGGMFGNIKIDMLKKRVKSKSEKFTGGEYVDYEEIKDDKN